MLKEPQLAPPRFVVPLPQGLGTSEGHAGGAALAARRAGNMLF